MAKSAVLLGNNIALVEAAHYGGRQRPTAILIRTSWTTGRQGAANGIAQAWHNPNNQVDSCHYVVDDRQVLRCVPDKVQAYHSRSEYNKRAISINMCYEPPSMPLPSVVFKTAQLTARLCKLYRIPVRILNDEEVQSWVIRKRKSRGGIILKTVGDFPTEDFFNSVQLKYRNF